MARTPYPTFLSGDSFSASQANTYWRDNDLAYWAYTTRGDMLYASATPTTTLTRLGIGTAYKFIQSNGTDPAWATLHYASVYHNTTQNVSNSVETILLFNSENTDPQGWHSTSLNTGRFTVTVTGYYVASVFFDYAGAGGAGTYRDLVKFIKNGALQFYRTQYQEVSADYKAYMLTTPIFPMTAADYLEVTLTQASGGTKAVQSGAAYSLWRVA